jgi:hypothetical protein
MAKKQFYEENSTGGSRGEITYHGKAVISINGKTVVQEESGYSYKPPPRKGTTSAEEAAAQGKKVSLPQEEIKRQSTAFQESLLTAVLANKVDDHISAGKRASRAAVPGHTPGDGALADSSTRDEVGHLPPSRSHGSVAQSTEAMWDRMHGKHLSPAQQAELEHVRNMISALTKSLESYKQAEKELMMK